MNRAIRRVFSIVISGLLIAATFSNPYSTAFAIQNTAQDATQNTAKDQPQPTKTKVSANAQDDFYTYINAEWLNKAASANEKYVDSFTEIEEKNDAALKSLLDEALKEGRDNATDDIAAMLRFYDMARDMKKRDELGLTPIQKYINMIESISSIYELQKAISKIPVDIFYSSYLGIDYSSSIDGTYAYFFDIGEFSLSYISNYDESTKSGIQQLESLKKYYTRLLTLAGEKPLDANKRALEAIKIEKQLVNIIRPSYSADYSDFKNFAELDNAVQSLNLSEIETVKLGTLPEAAKNTIAVETPDYFSKLDTVIKKDNLSALKSYILVQLLSHESVHLNSEMLKAYNDFHTAVDGKVDELYADTDELAYQIIVSTYPFEATQLFCEKYVPKQIKEEVTDMTKKIIATYKDRIQAIDWLSDPTKKEAIKKLDNLKLLIAYPEPDEISATSMTIKGCKLKSYEEGGSYSESWNTLAQYSLRSQIKLVGRSASNRNWSISPLTVNAYNQLEKNIIIIPAAILQKPFFSPDMSTSEKYGALGTIIGHEITHAFDTTGYKYDELGRERNWWTAADILMYQKRNIDLVIQYSAYADDASTSVGQTTLSENIADLGGVCSSLQTAQTLPGFDAKAFFKAFAICERSYGTEESSEYDSHSSSKARVNVLLSNIDLFHDTYGTKPGDGMYLAKDKRVQIW